MEVRHLELLRELSVRGTLAAVAAATYRTPSALSQQLRSAERELGLALTEPDSRGLRLTWAGQILADGADDVLAALARVQAELDRASGQDGSPGVGGRVRIGTLPSGGAALLPGLYAALEGSGVRLELDDFDLAESDYARRTLDCDIVIGHSLLADVPAGAEALSTRVLTREPIDVAVHAGHRLADRAVLRAADVTGEPWLAVPPGYPFATILERIEAATGERLHREVILRDNQLMAALVAQGVGLALLPRFSTPASEAIRLIPLAGVDARRAVVAISRPDRAERAAVRHVLDLLEGIGAALQEGQ